MKKRLLSIVFLLAALDLSAQTNFVPGYVVTLSGDTLRGDVDARGAQRSAISCRFRPAQSAEATDYGPTQLLSYTVTGGKTYVSQPVRDELIGVRPTFLEQLVSGPAQLLYLRDTKSIDRFYLKMGADSVQQLQQETRTDYGANGQKMAISSNAYLFTLAQAFSACPVLQPQIARTGFRMSDLARLVTAYNACVTPASIPVPTTLLPQYRSKAKLTVLAGAQVARIRVSNVTRAETRQMYSGIAPIGGLALHLPTAFINPHTAIQLQVLYSQQQYSGELPFFSQGNAKYTIKEATIRIPLLFRYTYSSRTIQPFIQAGVLAAFALKFDNSYITPAWFGNPYYVYKRPIIPEHRTGEQGALVSIGLNTAYPDKRNLSVEIRAESSNGFSDYNISGMPTRRLSVLFGYDLTK